MEEALSCHRRRQPATAISIGENHGGVRRKEDEEDEEDSFFELELTVPDSNPKICSPFIARTNSETTNFKDRPKGPAFVASFSVDRKQSTAKTPIDPKYNFPQSKRKIIPIESPFPRPHSPISLLKSAPRFRVFMFRKSKSVSAAARESEKAELRSGGRSFFTLRFKSKNNSSCSGSPLPGESNSKRFSKEAIQKYLRLVKPLYIKVSRRQAGGVKFPWQFSPTSSPATASAGFQCRHLGKSKSASASVTGIMSSPARRDDSLLQQHDGIEGAILHCKRSFSSSSRDLSPLSGTTSSQDKSQSPRSSSDGTSTS